MTLRTTNNCTSLRQGTTYRRCRLWRIVKKNGDIVRLTDHNRTIEYEGQTFIAASGGDTSDRRRDAGFKPGDQEFRTIVSDLITVEDLAGGLYDEARVDEWVVDWKYPWAGAFTTMVYFLNAVDFSGETLRAEAVTAAGILERIVGETMDADCRWDLGAPGCNRELAIASAPASWSPTHYGFVPDMIVTAVNSSIAFQATSIPPQYTNQTYSDGTTDIFFQFGRVFWTQGDNANTWSRIVNYDPVNRVLTLAVKTGYPVQNADRFDLYAGCDRRRITCREKWNNLSQFRGFEFIPTGGEVLDPP